MDDATFMAILTGSGILLTALIGVWIYLIISHFQKKKKAEIENKKYLKRCKIDKRILVQERRRKKGT